MAIDYDAEESLGRSPSPVHGMALHRVLHEKADKKTANESARVEVSSRAELIESIKRGESPTWVPNPALEALLAEYNMPPSEKPSQSPNTMSQPVESDEISPKSDTISLKTATQNPDLEIERPRSALHAGDFDDSDHSEPDFSLPPAWHGPTSYLTSHSEATSWSRPSSMCRSLSSSFAFQAPTSPLAQATNIELETDLGQISPSPDKAARRRTLPPDSYFSTQTPASPEAVNFSRPFLGLRRESSQPYQAHQPRRSSLLSSSSPLTTPTRPRRTSSSEHSPLQLAAMVGSFEESILRGRMSTAPSKPLEFIAQIGILGKGDCRANLKFPAHVTVPFPAVFYNYPSVGNRSLADESPSPYVGTIDLEHSLRPVEIHPGRRISTSTSSMEPMPSDNPTPEATRIGLDMNGTRPDEKPKSPIIHLGGCYRVAKTGQVQIVIKNPNRTAVKFFLVPYSLEGMKPGTKTFVRQRSFSAGPIDEQSSSGGQVSVTDRLQKKSILRYLIHLKFCCPSKGRYFLYGDIRVVFANRVPDGKEKLRNEVQVPEPRYSSFRPDRESMGSAGAKLTAEKARRRSSGPGLSASIDAMDGLSLGRPGLSLERAPDPFFQKLLNHQSRFSLGDATPNLFSDRRKSARSGIAPFAPPRSRNGSDIDLADESFARTVSPTLSDGEGLLSRELRMMEEARRDPGSDPMIRNSPSNPYYKSAACEESKDIQTRETDTADYT